MLMESSNSTPLPQHQILPGGISRRTSTLLPELGSQEVDSNGKVVAAEFTSSSDTEILMEASNSTLSHEHQNQSMDISPRICTLPPKSDSRKRNSNDDEILNSTGCSSDGLPQPKLSDPKPIVVVERLTKKDIEELTAGIWRCSICGKAERSFLILDLHVDTGCEALSPIECVFCPAVARNYSNFVVHFMEHQMGGRRKCPICLREDIRDMRQHLISQDHFSPNVSELDLNSSELQSEAKSLNNQKMVLISSLQSKRHRKLEKHKIIDTGKTPYKCDICQKGFSSLGNLNQHRRVHTGDKPFRCDICKKCFSFLHSLNRHQRVHTGEKPFKCDLCKKCFSDLGYFSYHQRVHTGEKPFKCDVCKKCFSGSSNLKSHVAGVHSGEKPFKCSVCKKSFSQKCHLTAHQRMHTGEKPFKCGLCKKSFSRLFSLKRHKSVCTQETF